MIKIHKSKNGQYYFTVHAKNGAVLVTSEMYTRKGNAKKAINSIADSMSRHLFEESKERCRKWAQKRGIEIVYTPKVLKV